MSDESVIGPKHQLPDPGGARADHQLPPSTPEHYPHTGRRIALWTFLLLFVLLIAMLLYRHHETVERAASHHPAEGITVTTATAQKGDIGIYLDAIGTVTPVYTDSITSEVNGLVVAVHFTEGQRVRKGDALIDIDDRPYRAMLLQAQGTLERDQNLLAQAKMDLERYRAAWARNGIAKQQLDDQEKLVLQDEGMVKNDQGVVQYDQVEVDFCHITAPISGRMGLRLVDPGNYVQSSGTTTLAVITQMEPTTVIFTIPEDSLGDVLARLNARARLSVDAFDRTAQTKLGGGTLLTVDNQIDTTTGTVKGRALFPNNNDVLFPNQFVNTRLLVNTLRGVTLIPSSAIQQNGQASTVYVIENGYAHQRSVKAGVTDKGTTQVEGINAGDVVADSGFDKLQDNVKVVISNTPAPSPGAAGTNPAGSTKPAASSAKGSNAP
jgi:membrane fusion protein, multidrug efflux system